MGILPFQKKQKKKASKPVVTTTATGYIAPKNIVTPSSATDAKPQPKWSPIRKLLSKTPSTPPPSSAALPTVSVAGHDQVEVMTLSSQQALLEQREVIRKQLFEQADNTDDAYMATNASQEVSPQGRIRSAASESPNDRFSIPLPIPTVAPSHSWDGSLQKLTEEPVRYAAQMRSQGPISVDHSFTESELASVISPAHMVAAAPVTPPKDAVNQSHGSHNAPMDERVEDDAVRTALNTGKSPLSGLPDDEQQEYQKDEMATLPPTPLRVLQGGWLPPILAGRGVVTPERTAAADQPAPSWSLARAAYDCGAFSLPQEKAAKVERAEAPRDEKAVSRSRNRERPVYLDEAAAVRFLRRITKNGFVLLYLQAPEEDGENAPGTFDDWKGRTVTMMINPGTWPRSGDPFDRPSPPQLEWTTVTGGQTTESTTTSMSLLSILSIATNDVEEDDDDDMCFFTVTSENGEVHIFETATLEERDRIVNGLQTLIARWSFQVIAGDMIATSELFESSAAPAMSEGGDEDIPSLPNPHHTLNGVSHMLLDAES